MLAAVVAIEETDEGREEEDAVVGRTGAVVLCDDSEADGAGLGPPAASVFVTVAGDVDTCVEVSDAPCAGARVEVSVDIWVSLIITVSLSPLSAR